MPSTVPQEKTVTRNKILKHKIVAIIRLKNNQMLHHLSIA